MSDKIQDLVARRLEQAAREQTKATLNLPQPFAIHNVGMPLVRVGELLGNVNNICYAVPAREDEAMLVQFVGDYFSVRQDTYPHAYAALLYLYENANKLPEGPAIEENQ